MSIRRILTCAVAGFALAQSAGATTLTEFTDNFTFRGQLAASTTVGFGGLADNSRVTGQYSPWGVTFVDGDDRIRLSATDFPNDGRGLSGGSSTEILFGNHWNAIGFNIPGEVQLQLFDGNTAVGQVLTFGRSGAASGSASGGRLAGGGSSFGGVISDTAFNRVIISDPVNGTTDLDDLTFGGSTVAPVPVPMSAILLGTALVGVGFVGRRRKTAAA